VLERARDLRAIRKVPFACTSRRIFSSLQTSSEYSLQSSTKRPAASSRPSVCPFARAGEFSNGLRNTYRDALTRGILLAPLVAQPLKASFLGTIILPSHEIPHTDDGCRYDEYDYRFGIFLREEEVLCRGVAALQYAGIRFQKAVGPTRRSCQVHTATAGYSRRLRHSFPVEAGGKSP
jgi:hypothetical protein